jgi:hypothetical protein
VRFRYRLGFKRLCAMPTCVDERVEIVFAALAKVHGQASRTIAPLCQKGTHTSPHLWSVSAQIINVGRLHQHVD